VYLQWIINKASGRIKFIVTTYVARLKGPEECDCGALAEKQQVFVSNMASKFAIFPLFPDSLRRFD
jgi:hypothetical protein